MEAVLAVAVGAVVFSALWAVNRALQRALSASGPPPVRRAITLAELSRLAGELRSAWDDGDSQRPPLSGGRGEDGLLFLEFLTLLPAEPDDVRYPRPRRIRVEERAAPNDQRRLVRWETPWKRASVPRPPPDPERTFARVRSARLFFRQGNEWTDRWPLPEGEHPRLPRSIRIEIEDLDGRPAGIEVWIACDMVLEPSNVRH